MAMSKVKDGPMVSIDKHIPYFPPQTRSGFNKKYPWAEMEVGDSFIHSASKYTARSSAAKEGDRLGRKFATRALPNGMVRIWRIK